MTCWYAQKTLPQNKPSAQKATFLVVEQVPVLVQGLGEAPDFGNGRLIGWEEVGQALCGYRYGRMGKRYAVRNQVKSRAKGD